MKEYLLSMKTYGERNHLLFVLGINAALRVSDLLSLKVKDVRGKKRLKLRESKNKNTRNNIIPPYVRKLIRAYVKNMDDDDYLFMSREGENRPITRQRVDQILKKAAKGVRLRDTRISTHSLRKTFGYWYYRNDPSKVLLLVEMFGHSCIRVTLVYIGVTQDEIDDSLVDFAL